MTGDLPFPPIGPEEPYPPSFSPLCVKLTLLSTSISARFFHRKHAIASFFSSGEIDGAPPFFIRISPSSAEVDRPRSLVEAQLEHFFGRGRA